MDIKMKTQGIGNIMNNHSFLIDNGNSIDKGRFQLVFKNKLMN